MNNLFLTKKGYPTLLYQAVQKFNRVLESDFKQQERLIYICDWMAQHNPELSNDIRRMINEGDTSHIIDHLMHYAEKDLSFISYSQYQKDKEVGFYHRTKIYQKGKENKGQDKTQSNNQDKKKGMGV
jgi:hypothetical protein